MSLDRTVVYLEDSEKKASDCCGYIQKNRRTVVFVHSDAVEPSGLYHLADEYDHPEDHKQYADDVDHCRYRKPGLGIHIYIAIMQELSEADVKTRQSDLCIGVIRTIVGYINYL